MGKAEREKGKRFEQFVARAFRDIFGDVATKRAGGESASRDRGRDLLYTPGFCIQCKVGKRPPIWDGLAEAKDAAHGTTDVPLLVAKKDRRDTVVVMRLSDFLFVAGFGKAR